MNARVSDDITATWLTDGRRPRLLVVDDQATTIHGLYRLLGEECQVYMATDAFRGQTLCRQHRPDLVLLDMVMPDMDGLELCRRLKADPDTRDIPVIFITGRNDDGAEAQALDAGAVDFLSKPINPRTVRARVRAHLTLKLQTDALRRMVFVDGLTGVFNRRHFDERLEAEWGRALRNRSPLGLLMLDVDHFKAYNDRHGHQAGDACLRELARLLRRCVRRSGDVIARFGGEEFACILPEAEPDAVMLLAWVIEQRVREALAGALPMVVPPTVVTVSIGVAVKPADVDAREFRVTDLLALADRQLYAAKAAGRACVLGGALGSPAPLAQPALPLPSAATR